MHILIIGGSVFLGKAMIDSALQSGHTITVFNRGKSNPHFQHQDITIIHGDRNDGFEILDGMHFDAVRGVNAVVTLNFEPARDNYTLSISV